MGTDEYMALSREEREHHLETLAPRDLLQLGIELFNARHFWHSHEAWEEAWIPSEQPLRWFYQGLIQVAAGLVHLTRREYPGTEKLLEEGLAKLEKYQPDFLTLEVGTLVQQASAVRQRVLDLGPKRLNEIDAASLPRIEQQTLPFSTFFEDGGPRLHYLEWPRTDGTPEGAIHRALTSGSWTAILIHPPAYVARIWQPVAARLAAQSYRVLAPDLPGHGLSAPAVGHIDEEIERLQQWLSRVAPGGKAIVSLGPSAGLAARLAAEAGALEVSMVPRDAFGQGDGEAFQLRRRHWPSRWEMFRTLRTRAQFARWRSDILWTYVEDGTVGLDDGTTELRCADETELRFLELGRPLDGAIEIEESPLVRPVEAAQHLIEIIEDS